MAREHYFIDRAQVKRNVKKVVRGEVVKEDMTAIGHQIPCILRNRSGKEDVQEPRTSLPESGLLILMPEDEAGDAIDIKQGDFIEMEYSENNELVARPSLYRVMSIWTPARRGSEIVSYQAEVTMFTEH